MSARSNHDTRLLGLLLLGGGKQTSAQLIRAGMTPTTIRRGLHALRLSGVRVLTVMHPGEPTIYELEKNKK